MRQSLIVKCAASQVTHKVHCFAIKQLCVGLWCDMDVHSSWLVIATPGGNLDGGSNQSPNSCFPGATRHAEKKRCNVVRSSG